MMITMDDLYDYIYNLSLDDETDIDFSDIIRQTSKIYIYIYIHKDVAEMIDIEYFMKINNTYTIKFCISACVKEM